MIYHGSTIENLKVIEPKESTQKGEYVYGTPNILYAAVFAIIQRTGYIFPPKFGTNPENLYLAERFENQFSTLKNLSASIYVLNEENFKSFEKDPEGHSSGDDIELRASGPQVVKQEIKIRNIYEYLEKSGLTFVEYKDRAKVGIPEDNKYLVQGIFRTYLWKIEGRKEEDIHRGEMHLTSSKKQIPEYGEFIDYIKNIILKLSQKEAEIFVEKFYDKKTNNFDFDFILEVEKNPQCDLRVADNQSRCK